MGAGNSLAVIDGTLPAAEPFFVFHGEIPQIDREKPKYHCTAEYLQKLRPDVYRAAVDMLVEPGVSIRSICRTLHVSHNTLASIQEREAANLDTRKKGILKTISRGLRLSAERLEELAPELSGRDAIIAVGVLTEKLQLLGGEATARIETSAGGDIFSKMAALHAELSAMAAAKPLQATVVPSQNGLTDEGAEQKGAAVAASLTAGEQEL